LISQTDMKRFTMPILHKTGLVVQDPGWAYSAYSQRKRDKQQEWSKSRPD